MGRNGRKGITAFMKGMAVFQQYQRCQKKPNQSPTSAMCA